VSPRPAALAVLEAFSKPSDKSSIAMAQAGLMHVNEVLAARTLTQVSQQAGVPS
jgi:hypothetical protein